MRTLLLIISFIAQAATVFAQSDTIRFQLINAEDGTVLFVPVNQIYPVTKDSVQIQATEIIALSLSANIDKPFYFEWGGWRSRLITLRKDSAYLQVLPITMHDFGYYKQYYEAHECPICGDTKKLLPIRYSLLTVTTVSNKKKKAKKYFDGGNCIVQPWTPKLYCGKDDFQF
ncbi:hypothetical protein [Phnomibacter sp. MR]|uniref:hypothetical protein n=1 Tax=Phnomibacter sp. MR TaxID=3042318 RepID=UPI003A7FF708